jgi:hypothetical protein
MSLSLTYPEIVQTLNLHVIAFEVRWKLRASLLCYRQMGLRLTVEAGPDTYDAA